MRQMLSHRPLVLVAAGLVLGILAIQNWAAALLLLLLLLLLRELRACLICVLAFLVGAIITPATTHVIFPKQWIDSDARVLSVPKLYPTEKVALVQVGDNKLMLSCPNDVPLQLGQVIHIHAEAKPLDDTSNRLADRGIFGRIRANRILIVKNAPWIDRIGQAWRDSFVAFADETLPSKAAAAVEAVCFDVQSRLDANDREAFVRAGTVHAISASGLHVGVLVLLLFGIMSFFPIPRWVQLSVVALSLLLYCIASGLHPPVLRASIVSITLAAAFWFRREPDFLSAIGLAAVVQLLWDPTTVYDAGFQLTFVVLAAVALFSSTKSSPGKALSSQAKERFRYHLSRAALVAVVAAPLAAYDFGTVSLTSLGSNILAVIVLPVLVSSAIIAHLISFLSAAIATGIIVAVVEPLSGWLLFVTDRLGADWAAINVPAFSGYWVLLIYGLMLVVWRLRLRPS